MTKLWAVVAKTYVRYPSAKEGRNLWHEKETLLEFERAETEEEAEQSVKLRTQDTLKEEQETHNETHPNTPIALCVNSELQVRLVPSNPPPTLPSWLAKLKRGDLVRSEYGANYPGELAAYEFLEAHTLPSMGSGFGVYLLVDGEPELLDSAWIHRPVESFN